MSHERATWIPYDNLPPGFPHGLEEGGTPAEAQPAATVVLLRDGDTGLEAFLMRRNRSSGFVPGAYVFPGGRVDPRDADPGLVGLVDAMPPDPPARYWMAAVRELYEETGVLLAGCDAGAKWRDALLEDRVALLEVVRACGGRIRLRDVVYFAHWITPLAEPRRYDTRFFAAALPSGAEAKPDAREMSDAAWFSTARALERFQRGELPMVFPTVRTLELLEGHATVAAALDALRGRTVRAVLPRLVRTAEGVRLVVDEDEEEEHG